jgi:hypothetical protein
MIEVSAQRDGRKGVIEHGWSAAEFLVVRGEFGPTIGSQPWMGNVMIVGSPSVCTGGPVMEFLHRELDLQPGDEVEVTLDSPANVMLLDPDNFSNYQQDTSYRYYGGHAEKSPVRLSPPHSGKWYVVVNLGGYAGTVRAGVRVVRGQGVLR